MSARWLLQRVGVLLFTLLVTGLLAATMVRLAPGFGIDEQALDPRWNQQKLAMRGGAQGGHQSILLFYWHYLTGMFRGDLGESTALSAPVSQLLAERLPVTAGLAGKGLLLGWLLAAGLALITTRWRSSLVGLPAAWFCGLFLCTPAALVALGCAILGGPAPLAMAASLFPKIFEYARNLLGELARSPHVLGARARGLSERRVLFVHVLPPAIPQLLALGGVSISLAFGAAVPIEALCDLPGIGQLAWKAALGRDLPVLVSLTMLVALATLVANAVAEIAGRAWEAKTL
jgi:peptide/nickel transport system permease protein